MTHRAWSIVLTALVLTAGLAATLPAAQTASTEWTEGKLPIATVGTAAVHHDGATYLFGGRKADDTYASDIWKYDHATGTTTRVAQFPVTPDAPNRGRFSGAAVGVGDRIYYFGGATLVEVDVNGDGRPERVPKATRDIFEFNPVNNQITHLLERLDEPAWGLAGTAVRGKAYLFGGFSFDVSNLAATKRHNWIVEFDPGPKDARVLGDKLPYRVQDAAVAHLDQRIYVMGGLSDHDADYNPCPTYQYYNPETDQTETRQIEVCLTKKIVSFDPASRLVRGVTTKELPYRVQFAGAAVVGDNAYLPGGYLSDGTAATSIVEVSSRNQLPTARVVTPVLPEGAFGQGVTTDGSAVYAFGGRTGGTNELTSRIVRLDPSPSVPWPPRAARAEPVPGGAGMTISWEAPAYDGGSLVTGYRVYRTPDGGDETLIAETHLLEYEDTGTEPGATYSWRITSLNAVGESNASAYVGRAAEATVPGPVASFHAYPGNQQVVLRWTPPTDAGGANVTGYRLYRDGELLQSFGPNAREHVDDNLENGRAYAYVLRAYNVKGNGEASATRTVAPAPVPQAPSNVNAQAEATDDQAPPRVVLTWMPPSEAIQRYVVVRALTPGAEAGEVVANLSSDATSFTDTQVERGQTYYYAIKTVNDAGESPPSESVSVSLVRKPGPPTNVAAIGLEGGVRITWQPPADTGDAPAESLRYYVSREGGGSSRSIIIETDIQGLAYTDRTVTPEREYAYTVTTLNPRASDPSAPATATPRAIRNEPPTAVLAALPSVTSAGDPVQFDASQSSDDGGAIREYVFDFGDGTNPVRGASPSVTHEYARNGTFTATVITTDQHGATSAPATARIVVGEVVPSQPPETGITGLNPSGNGDGDGNGSTFQRPPGSKTPGVPGPGVAAGLAALGAAALVLRRRRLG